MKKTAYVLPALVATFAIALLVTTPHVLADSEDRIHHGMKSHKGNWAVPVQDFEGSILITEDIDRKALKEIESIPLSEAAKGLDVQKAKLGLAVNDEGNKYLVWKLILFDKDSESENPLVTINIVDAGNSENTATITKEFDKSKSHEKRSYYKGMKAKYAQMTPEEREAKFAQFKEMKEAFASLSEDDRSAIKSHFKDMKEQFADLTQEEKEAKHAEYKQKMKEFMEMSLEAKIKHLEELAGSLRA